MIKENTYVYLVSHTSPSLFGLSIILHEKYYTDEEFDTLLEEALTSTTFDTMDDYEDDGIGTYEITFKDVYQRAVDYLIENHGFKTVSYDNKAYFATNELIYTTEKYPDKHPPKLIKRVRSIIEESENSQDDEEDELGLDD